ncbi:MAG: energy-coupling factor ABC transporter ATP-binding protein [Thermaerobacter sp.]|nr:energy-coupling factor ABC transporter ATP-binding protein [Thermaerobacter sp.]
MLEVRDINMVRHERKILGIERICLSEGPFVAIIGRNGAGKSSLVKALGLLAAFSCSAYVLHGQVKNLQHERLAIMRQYAHGFQSPAFLRGDVLYNVALPLLLRGMGRGEAEIAARKWLSLVQAENLAARLPQTLSGGEGARVSLARALVTSPQILFLDEPFSGLDVESQAYILRHLRGWLTESRTTGVLVTHSYSEVAHLADRLLVMNDGRIIADGPPSVVLANPRPGFLRDFVSVGSRTETLA